MSHSQLLRCWVWFGFNPLGCLKNYRHLPSQVWEVRVLWGFSCWIVLKHACQLRYDEKVQLLADAAAAVARRVMVSELQAATGFARHNAEGLSVN